jgi:hypothetical protein
LYHTTGFNLSKNSKHFFLPSIWEEITDSTDFYGWDFLKPLIGKSVFWASVNWNNQHQNLPSGYSYYLIKTEGPNVDWIKKQALLVDGLIFVCCLPNDYDYFKSYTNVHFLPCVEWHYQLDTMLKLFGSDVVKSVDHKVSILTHRVTYSKLVALSAVLENIKSNEVYYSLHDWIEEKNVHHWQDTDNSTVNYYKNLFLKEFKSCQRTTDIDFLTNKNNISLLHDYHHPAYQNAAINITNESWNYSLQIDHPIPGPFITEKTLKCLLGETAFLANGQFDTYKTLENFGFEFDYDLDLSFDQIVGDLDRLEKLINTIKSLKDIDTHDLYHQTRPSCLHNKHWIVSGDFYRRAEQFNKSSIEKMINVLN